MELSVFWRVFFYFIIYFSHRHEFNPFYVRFVCVCVWHFHKRGCYYWPFILWIKKKSFENCLMWFRLNLNAIICTYTKLFCGHLTPVRIFEWQLFLWWQLYLLFFFSFPFSFRRKSKYSIKYYFTFYFQFHFGWWILSWCCFFFLFVDAILKITWTAPKWRIKSLFAIKTR